MRLRVKARRGIPITTRVFLSGFRYYSRCCWWSAQIPLASPILSPHMPPASSHKHLRHSALRLSLATGTGLAYLEHFEELALVGRAGEKFNASVPRFSHPNRGGNSGASSLSVFQIFWRMKQKVPFFSSLCYFPTLPAVFLGSPNKLLLSNLHLLVRFWGNPN